MRCRVLILLLILGCSMNLAPDNGSTGKTDFIYSALEIIDRIFTVLDVFIGNILCTVKLSIMYFCCGLELCLELFCHMIHCAAVSYCYNTCDQTKRPVQATGERNIAPAKRGKRAQLML